MQLLLVEDNADLSASIGTYLDRRGHIMDYAHDGNVALKLATTNSYHVLILDIGLPDLNGLELCRRLRNDHGISTPILFLTARDTLDDKIRGFSAGGDDYLIKPFAMAELEARLEALQRRSEGQAHRRQLVVANLVFDLDTLHIERAGRTLYIKPAARRVLEVLMRNSHRVVSKEELEAALWGDEPPEADALRVHVHSLRTAIDGPFDEPLISTVRGVGYRLSQID